MMDRVFKIGIVDTFTVCDMDSSWHVFSGFVYDTEFAMSRDCGQIFVIISIEH